MLFKGVDLDSSNKEMDFETIREENDMSFPSTFSLDMYVTTLGI